MADIYFLGTANAVQQESRATPANVEVGDVFSLLIAGVTIATYTAAAATVADVTAGLTAAWEAAKADHPYSAGITASDQTTYIKLLADTAGLPFTVTATATNGGAADTQTLTMTTPTVNAGPNVLDTAENYSGGSVPGAGDTLILADCAVNLCWGLDQIAELAAINIKASYTGRIGLDRTKFATSADGTTYDATKQEYRPTYLKTVYANAYIGATDSPGTSAGSKRIKLDHDGGSGSANVFVYSTATSSAESNLPAVRLLGADLDGINLYVRSAPGGVGCAVDAPGEVFVAGIVSISDPTGTSKVIMGEDVEFTAGGWYQLGGENVLRSTTTLPYCKVKGGKLRIEGDFTSTAYTIWGGVVIDNHYKTAGNAVTTAELEGGETDLTQSAFARTWATVNPHKGCTLKVDKDIVTFTTFNLPESKTTIVVS